MHPESQATKKDAMQLTHPMVVAKGKASALVTVGKWPGAVWMFVQRHTVRPWNPRSARRAWTLRLRRRRCVYTKFHTTAQRWQHSSRGTHLLNLPLTIGGSHSSLLGCRLARKQWPREEACWASRLATSTTLYGQVAASTRSGTVCRFAWLRERC